MVIARLGFVAWWWWRTGGWSRFNRFRTLYGAGNRRKKENYRGRGQAKKEKGRRRVDTWKDQWKSESRWKNKRAPGSLICTFLSLFVYLYTSITYQTRPPCFLANTRYRSTCASVVLGRVTASAASTCPGVSMAGGIESVAAGAAEEARAWSAARRRRLAKSAPEYPSVRAARALCVYMWCVEG